MAGSNYTEKSLKGTVTEEAIGAVTDAAVAKKYSYGSSSEVAGDDSDEVESVPAVNMGRNS